ncbi:MAG: sigma 54-interacting transcriptional regulator [Smithellaceae bacterium]
MQRHNILELVEEMDSQELSSMQIAAVLGETFCLDHILAVNDIKPSKLLDLFNRLIKAKVIKKEIKAASGTYFFCSPKFSDVFLESMDEEKKKTYLFLLTDHLEKDLQKDEKNIQILANLYLQFSAAKENFQYIKKAADLLISVHRTQDGLALYKEIIDGLWEKNRDPLETVLLIDTVISYAPLVIYVQSPENILNIVNQTIIMADKLENKRARVMLELCLGAIYQKPGQFLDAFPHYHLGWTLAQEIKDADLIKNAAKLYALSLFWQGRFREAIQIYEENLGNVEKISPQLKELWPHLMLAWSYAISGRIGRGLGLVETTREMAVSRGDLKTQAFAHGVIALIFIEAQMHEQAELHANAAIKIGEKIGSNQALFIAKPCKAYIEMVRGDLDKAKELWESTIALQKKLGMEGYNTAWIFDVQAAVSDKSSMIGDDRSPILQHKMNNIYIKGVALRYDASKIQYENNIEMREQLLIKSHGLLVEAGANIELGKTQIELAKLYIEKKNGKKAIEFADKAYSSLSEINKSLFPAELTFIIGEKSQEVRWNYGVSQLESSTKLLPDFDKYLGNVVEILTGMFGAERAAILLLKEEGISEELQVAAMRNFSPEDIGQLSRGPLQSIIASALRNLKPLIISGDEENKELLQLSREAIHVKSLAIIPLVSANRAIGMIYMDNRLLDEIFSAQDVIIMTAIATQVSLAFQTNILTKELDGIRRNYQEVNCYPAQTETVIGKFPKIIGKSKALKDVLNKSKKVAQTHATVLIYGETGVGKELIANVIHQLSERNNKPFIVVNISALNENLTTSELFGHEKGSFTGAVRSKPGRFEMAKGGTIFLDEVSEMSLDTQVKLLRILQEHTFERVGGTKTLSSDFRLIVATNKDLRQKVATGEFRSDLYFRMSSFPIEIPPLRERIDDIPLLAFHFVAKHSKSNNKNISRIPNSEMKKLLEYSWPGNIRELENVIENAVILSEGETLTIPAFESTVPVIRKTVHEAKLMPLSEIERTHIINILKHTRWRIRGERGAAKILGLKPTTLEFRIKKLGIKDHEASWGDTRGMDG